MFVLLPWKCDYQNEEDVRKAFKNNDFFMISGPRGQMCTNRVELERTLGRGFYVTVVYNKLSCLVKIEV